MTIDARHRDKSGEISRKHGNTLIGTLRKHYGAGFAKGWHGSEKLGEVLHKLDEPSLTKLLRALRWADWSQSAANNLLLAHSPRFKRKDRMSKNLGPPCPICGGAIGH
jgi:hypothetical protein